MRESLHLGVELYEFVSPAVMKTLSLVRTEQRPISALLASVHKQVGYPQRIEQISSTVFFLSGVLLEIQKLKHVCMPRFQIDCKSSLSLSSSSIGRVFQR